MRAIATPRGTEIISPADIAYEDPKPQGNFEKLIIPLKRAQNFFLIEARIDTLVGNFILDTGAPQLVLNKTYFHKWKLSEGTTPMV